MSAPVIYDPATRTMHSATGAATDEPVCRCEIAHPMPWDMSMLNPDTVTKAPCLVAELEKT